MTIARTLLALAAATQLFACAAPAQNTRLEGTIVVDRMHDMHHGAPIRVAFRTVDPEGACEEAACRSFVPVENCTVGAERDPRKLQVVLGHDSHVFAACTGELPEGRQIELLAYIDLDEDGELGDDEPRVTRSLEDSRDQTALELRINRL